MIFPILRGLVDWRAAPVTWAIVILNLVMLIYTSNTAVEAQNGLDALMRNNFFINTQGRLYAHYLSDSPDREYPLFLRTLGEKVEAGDTEQLSTLGSLAFRDTGFLNSLRELPFGSDPVAFKFWLKNKDQVQMFEELHPSFALGLNTQDPSFHKWISYIFVHSGFLHFAGNMLFLLLFGAALEAQIGGLAMLVTFLLFGVSAAGVFALMTGVTSSPLVGASGAISGTMALFCALNWRKPTRFFYWFFLPLPGYIGLVYLPAWVALAMALVSDLAGYLSTVPELGGIAHTAHLGGDAAGLLTALILFALRRGKSANNETELKPMAVLLPFLFQGRRPVIPEQSPAASYSP